jgi:hypothetical protein
MIDPQSMGDYNAHVLEWREDTSAYRTALSSAAVADAKHKASWSKELIRAKQADSKLGADFAKAIADSNPDVELLATDRMVKNAVVEGLKKKLEWDRAYADNLRTNVVNEREENRMASEASGSQPRWSPPGGRASDYRDRQPEDSTPPDAQLGAEPASPAPPPVTPAHDPDPSGGLSGLPYVTREENAHGAANLARDLGASDEEIAKMHALGLSGNYPNAGELRKMVEAYFDPEPESEDEPEESAPVIEGRVY